MTPNALTLLKVGDEVVELDAVGNIVLQTRAVVIEVQRTPAITYVYTDSEDYRCYPFNTSTGEAQLAEWGFDGRETRIDIAKLV
jgi:hypothetical protein